MIPDAAFDTPVLRGLDAAAREAITSAARVVEHGALAKIYGEGEASDSFYVVLDGAVELRAVRRGDEAASLLRVARRGDSFGEEAMLAGIPRRVSATAAAPARLAEIPVAVFLRVTGKLDDANAARERRYLARAAAKDLLAQSAFARDLGVADAELLLDAIRLERFARGAHLYEAGDRAESLYFVVEGLVQLQRDSSVIAYVQRGDFVGDEELLVAAPRALAAIAAGDSWCATVPREAVRTLADRNPELLPRLRRIAASRDAGQAAVIGDAAARSTQHVFKDLYRMQMARSLLVIDQDSCTRCGHCAWSCEDVHGVSRLVRRGDKVITRVGDGTAALLLPNTCQHCRHAACMIDCPTGAIGRDPEGEVFVRADLCTGCGNCVKACPWDNIQLAARLEARPVAVKCDLCRGFDAPVCVEACPTDAIRRLDPQRDVAEVAELLGQAPVTRTRARRGWSSVAIGTAIAASAFGATRDWSPAHGAGHIAGWIAAILILALTAYVIPKRWIRTRPRVRGVARVARSRTKAHLIAHVLLGAIAPAAALAHAGTHLPGGTAGALVVALAAATVLGGFGAIAYRALPAALTRLERKGALPEDLRGERAALLARLYKEASGASRRAKLLADRVLVPYARAPLGWIALVASRRGLTDEEAHLRARVERVLEGRGAGLVDEIAPMVRVAVELRALPARRAMTHALRGWMPLHIVSAAIVVALLIAHVVHP